MLLSFKGEKKQDGDDDDEEEEKLPHFPLLPTHHPLPSPSLPPYCQPL